jgi:sugar lactone lactonase YvrE
MQDDPFKKDKNGFISKVDLDGNILKLKWVKGLNAPKGLAISKGKLYVGDVDQLVEIDIKKGKVSNKYDAIGAALLNDVAADTKGNIYVSDTFTDTIYRLNTFGQLTKWLYSPKLQAPNGLHYEKGQLIVGSWGHPTDGWSAAEVGHLKTISLKTKKIKSLGSGKAVGNLDGVESDGKGAYYVADWVGGKLLHIQRNGYFKEVLKLSQGVADHEIIHDKNIIIIPMMLEGKLITYKIN